MVYMKPSTEAKGEEGYDRASTLLKRKTTRVKGEEERGTQRRRSVKSKPPTPTPSTGADGEEGETEHRSEPSDDDDDSAGLGSF
jgi:hypothetical protein